MGVQWNLFLEPTARRTSRLDFWGHPLSANWNMKPRVPWNSSRWFLFPFNGYQYTKHYSSYFRKKKCAPPNFHAGDKCGVAPGQLEPLHGRQGWCWQLQLDTSQTHCRSSDLGGCPWLVLPVMHCFETLKNFSGPKKCFSSPTFAT